jgi:hypothetical protein
MSEAKAEAKRWPLDLSSLSKGDIVKAEQIESAYATPRHAPKYRFRQLAMRARIELEFYERGLEVTVRCIGDDVHILTDEAAVYFQDKELIHGYRRMRRRYAKLAGAELNELPELALRRYERAVIVHGRAIQGMETGRKEGLKLAAVERQTPGKLT